MAEIRKVEALAAKYGIGKGLATKIIRGQTFYEVLQHAKTVNELKLVLEEMLYDLYPRENRLIGFEKE